jgi:phospholipid/cholesterol/gamma-HCH transport system ATP-binding protein
MAASAYIEIHDLHFSRGPRIIFDGLSMEIPRGKITGIMGPSGTGKTTLLRIIGGQLKPELFELRKHMGMLFQSSALFTDLTVFENVAFPLREHTTLPEDSIRDLVLIKLNAVGLRGARDLYPSELSGGMSRRVALARAIALDPDLLMYDEPFTGQDPIAMGVLMTLIKNLNLTLKTTNIVVSHDIHETSAIADKLYVIADGRVIGAGTPESLRDDGSELIRQFMHGRPDGPVPFHYPADDIGSDLIGGARA